MKNLLLLITLFFYNYFLFSQDIVLTILNSKTNEPIEDAHVKYEKVIYTSNNEGKVFVTNFKEGVYYFSHIRFESQEKTLGYEKAQTIFLTEKNNRLSEVLITKKKKKGMHFEALPIMEKGMHGFASVLYKGKIYVFGGNLTKDVDSYGKALDVASDRQKPKIGDLIFESRKYYSFTKFNNKLHVYDIDNKNWTTTKINLLKRAYHKAVLVEDKVFLFGGVKLSKNKTREYLDSTVEVYNLKTNKLEKKIKSTHRAVNSGVVNVEESVILVGGSIKEFKNKKKKFSNSVKLYDTNKNKWYSIGNLPDPKETECTVINNKLYSIGGYNNNELSTITSFHLRTGRWQIEKKLPVNIKDATIEKRSELIYIFNDYKFYVYNTLSKNLRQYKIGLPYESSEMFIFKNKLYVFGGFEKTAYEKIPSKGLFSIDLKELENTHYITL